MIKEEKILEIGIRINKKLKLKIQDENGREIVEVEFQRKKLEMKMIL